MRAEVAAERENAKAVGERNGVDADADNEAENAEGSGGTGRPVPIGSNARM